MPRTGTDGSPAQNPYYPSAHFICCSIIIPRVHISENSGFGSVRKDHMQRKHESGHTERRDIYRRGFESCFSAFLPGRFRIIVRHVAAGIRRFLLFRRFRLFRQRRTPAQIRKTSGYAPGVSGVFLRRRIFRPCSGLRGISGRSGIRRFRNFSLLRLRNFRLLSVCLFLFRAHSMPPSLHMLFRPAFRFRHSR